MKTKIFCEAGREEGLGHLTRCWRLKKVLSRFCPDAELCCAGGEDALPVDMRVDWLKKDKLKDLLKGVSIAVIDSYKADFSLYALAFSLTKRLIVFDDFNRFPYPGGTIILNGALGAQKLYENPENHLVGIEFALIDEVFFASKTPRENVEDVLAIFGGTDPFNNARKVVQTLRDCSFRLHVVSRDPQVPEGKNVRRYSNLSALQTANLMKLSDVAISAGGGTLNELAASKTPTLIIVAAPNQEFQSVRWNENGGMKITDFNRLATDLEALKPLQTRKEMIARFENVPFGEKLQARLSEIISGLSEG